MTSNAQLDALGAAIAQNGIGGVPTPSGPVFYSTVTGQITLVSGNEYNLGGGTIVAFQTTFNALSASQRSQHQSLVDALGNALAVPGTPVFYSNGQISISWGNAYNLGWGYLANIAAAFNALSAVLASPAPTPTKFVRGILVGGESIMANEGGAAVANGPIAYTMRHASRQWNLSPLTGALAPMSIPMPDVSWVCDNFIPQMADLLLDTLPIEHLLICDIAQVGMKFADFAPPSGQFSARIANSLGYFAAQRIVPSVVMWGMGINDAEAGTPAATVMANAEVVIGGFRNGGYTGPIVFSLETIFNNGPVYQPVIDGLTAAVAASPNCFIGPNHDALLGPADRYDGTHPGYSGETKLAQAWASAIAPYLQ